MLVAVKAAALWSILLAVVAGPPAPKPGIVAKQWQAQRKPSAGPALSIGTTSCGCLQGAATLPASGPGYEVLRLGRNRRFGHPTLIAYIRRLAAAAASGKLGLVVVGDLSQPRGGPTPSGHRSHQTGLDADIGYAAPPGVIFKCSGFETGAANLYDGQQKALTSALTGSGEARDELGLMLECK
jgi:penicillin-insensitive murein endopeptidase